jgi:O-acetyl-ADP-ribose deacetylase (regulator of RNase III)
VYGYPIERAALVTLRALRDALAEAETVRRVGLVLRSEDALEVFAAALDELR